MHLVDEYGCNISNVSCTNFSVITMTYLLRGSIFLAHAICLFSSAHTCGEELPSSAKRVLESYNSAVESASSKLRREHEAAQKSISLQLNAALQRGDQVTAKALADVKAGLEAHWQGTIASLNRVNIGNQAPAGGVEQPFALGQFGVVQIDATSETGTFVSGPVRAGDSITLQYVRGQWSNSNIGTDSPDSAGDPQLRLGIAGWSAADKLHNSLLVSVPTKTVVSPYTYVFNKNYDRVSLRIADGWGVYSDNQGMAVYNVRFRRQ